MTNTKTILENAARLRRMSERIHECFRRDPHRPEHTAACKELDDVYCALAFPGGLDIAFERLKIHDPLIVADVIEFLQVDPQYFRSGYHKEHMLRILKSYSLSSEQSGSLYHLLLRSIEHGPKRIFMAYARLAPKLNISSEQAGPLANLSNSFNLEVRRRANHVLELIKKNDIL